MAHRDPSSPTPMPTVLRYGIAFLSVAIAIGLDFFLLRQFEAILTPFLFAVAATVWYAGTWPGVLAIVLSVLSLNYFFLRPVFSFSPISSADLVYLTFCIFCALTVGWISTARRRAEQELRQAREELEAKVVERTANLQRSENYLAETQKLTHTGCWAWDARSQKVLHCSEEMFRIFGLDPQEHLPTRKNFRQRVHPEDRNRVDERFARVVNEKVDSFDEYRVLLPDGAVKHVNSTAHPVLDGNGELIEFIATATDVTERKRAEEALRESEAKIRRLVDSNIIGIFIWDFDGSVLEANDEFLRMVNYDREDLVSGRIRWMDLTPPDWRERDNAKIEQQKISGRLEPFEKEYTRKDGRRVPVLIGVATFEDGGNQGVAFVLDLTERKRAEQSLMRSEAYLAETLKLTHTGSWAWDPRTEKVLYCSEEMFRLFGLDPRESSPSRESFRQQIHPEDRDWVKRKFEESLRERVDTFAEYRVLLQDGTVRHIKASGHPVLNEDCELVEFIGTATDVTEGKRAEEALRESEAKIRRLVDSNIIGIFFSGLEGRVLQANDAFLQLVGHDRNDLVSGRICWTDLTPSEWHERDKRALAELSSNTIAQPYEKEFFRKDGRRVPVMIGGALFEKDGNEGVAFVLDLTERKRAEDALREREAQLAEARRELRQMIDTIPIPVASYSVDARRDFVNAAWKNYTGLSDEAARGTEWSVVAHPEDTAGGNKMWRDALATGEPWHTEERVRRADGQYRWFAIDRVAACDDDGKIIKWYGTAYDIEDRKRAEDGLRESEAKFRDYAETASDWFWEIGPDYKFTLLTENAFGSHSADRIGTAYWDHALDLETEPEKWRLIRETLDSRKPFRDFVYCGLSGDSTPMYVRASGKPMFDVDGEFRGYRGTGTDVTAIMRAQEALRESERSARSAIDGIAGLVAIMAPNGELDALNRQVIEYFGRSLEEMKNWGTSDAVHPEDLPRIAEIFQRSMATGTPFHYELRLRRFDGEYRWFDNRCVPIHEESGRIVRWYMLGTDIEERKRAEQALREREAKIRRLVDSNIIGIFIWDFDGRILEANDEFLRMVRYDREDLVSGGIRWADLTPPDWRDRNNARIEQQKSSGRFDPFEKEFTRKDGRRVPILIGGATFEEGGNQGVAYVLDLTVRKRVEAEARESERRYREAQLELAHANRVATMGQLSASITHEVNQPITAAVTYALAARRWLRADPPNFREVDDALSLIVKEGNRAGEVVGRIRALIKKAPARKDAVAINDAILEVIALTRTEAANNSISVRTQLAEGLPHVQGDRVQLQQVLLNLIINAIEAMREVGEKERELFISSRNEPDGVSVEVRDSGPGFAPAAIERVFEAFYTTKPSGLGLGLSICRSIIEAHNGRLGASPNVPRGAIFGFIVPAHPAAAS